VTVLFPAVCLPEPWKRLNPSSETCFEWEELLGSQFFLLNRGLIAGAEMAIRDTKVSRMAQMVELLILFVNMQLVYISLLDTMI